MECFKIQNLTFTYPEQEIPALRGIDLSLYPGDFAVLAGSSGCGKSTLLRQLKTVLAPHGKKEGMILFNGRVLEEVDSRTQTAKIGFADNKPKQSTTELVLDALSNTEMINATEHVIENMIKVLKNKHTKYNNLPDKIDLSDDDKNKITNACDISIVAKNVILQYI